jgi:uncharacterized membrane protein YuzA (DUF378 family)
MRRDGTTLRVHPLDWLSLTLVIVGALNWGLVGVGMLVVGESAVESWNLVNLVVGSVPILEALIYVLVGLAGLYELYFAYKLYTVEPPGAATSAD